MKTFHSISSLIAAAVLTAGCSGSFSSTPVEIPAVVEVGVKGQVQKLEKSFTDGGLNVTEAKALAEAMIVGGGGTTEANETLVTYDKAPDMLQAGMTKLSTTSFTSDTRKRLAIPLYAPALFSLFNEQLTALSDANLITFTGNLLTAQVKASGAPQFNAENHRTSFRSMLSAMLKTSAAYVETADARSSLWKAMADKSVVELDTLNLFASNMKSVLGNLAGGVYEGTIAVPGLSVGEKSELMIEFTARVYANIADTALSTADLLEASTNIDDEITAIIAADADLNAAPILNLQLTKSSKEGAGCIATAKWVYMFQYNDSRCQTVTKKWIEGPKGSSPMNRGFPNHAFCFRDDATGKYHNWLAAGTGCTTADPASGAAFPNNPSPRNLTTTPAGGFACQYGYAGAETGTNGESREKCEGRGNALFIAGGADDYTEVWVSGTLKAVFDVANGGITFPAIANVCTVTTTGAVIRQTHYVRTSAECRTWCELIISEDSTTPYDCKLAGTLLHSYTANSVTAPTVTPITNTTALTTAPTSFTKGVCTRFGVTLLRDSDSLAQSGLSQALSFEGTTSNTSGTTGYRLPVYLDSACTRLAIIPRLPSDATEASFYVKAPTDALTIDLRVTPLFDGAQGSTSLGITVP